MKNFNVLVCLVLVLVWSSQVFGQNLSASAQNALNKLEKEYFPRLRTQKAEIESQRSSIASVKCNNYIDEVNRTVGVWNSIPKSELRNPKLVSAKQELDTYIAFAKEAQTIFRERKAAEQSGVANNNTNQANSNAVNIGNFKVGDKVSVLSSSEWTWGTITGIAGKDFQPRAGIVGEDVEVDIQIKVSYLPAGKQRVAAKNIYSFWNYHEFMQEVLKMKNKEIKEFFNMMYEVTGKNTAPGYGVFTPNGQNLLKLNKEVKTIEDLFNRFPALPSDAEKLGDRGYNENVYAYKKALEGKDEFLKKKIDERIKEHIRLINENNFSPESILVGSQVKYVDEPKRTVFWSDLLCGSSENIKKAILKDINDFLSEVGMPSNAESYLSNWNTLAAEKKSKIEQEANKNMNWATQYPFTDAQAPTLVKRDLGGNPTKIIFKTNAPKIESDKSKRKYGIAFYPKKGDCPYIPYTEFYILETYRGPGKYDAPRCVFGGTGYTKTM